MATYMHTSLSTSYSVHINQTSNDDKIMESDTSEACPLSVPHFSSRSVSPLLSRPTSFIILFHATITFSTSLLDPKPRNSVFRTGRRNWSESLEGEVCLDIWMGWDGMEWMDMVGGVKGRRGSGSWGVRKGKSELVFWSIYMKTINTVHIGNLVSFFYNCSYE